MNSKSMLIITFFFLPNCFDYQPEGIRLRIYQWGLLSRREEAGKGGQLMKSKTKNVS